MTMKTIPIPEEICNHVTSIYGIYLLWIRITRIRITESFFVSSRFVYVDMKSINVSHIMNISRWIKHIVYPSIRVVALRGWWSIEKKMRVDQSLDAGPVMWTCSLYPGTYLWSRFGHREIILGLTFDCVKVTHLEVLIIVCFVVNTTIYKRGYI